MDEEEKRGGPEREEAVPAPAADPLPSEEGRAEEVVPQSDTAGKERKEGVSETDPNKTDGESFADRYHYAKQKDMEKLSKEIEEKNGHDTAKKRRNWWIKTALLLLLIGASIALMFTIPGLIPNEDGETKGFVDMISNINWIWFAILIGVLLLALFSESMKYAYLLKTATGKWYIRPSVKVMFLGKYYDGITPLGTGGQPFQIYYLHKKNIPAGAATAVPLVRYIVATFVFCAVAIGLFITAHFVIASGTISTTYLIVAWISMAFNLAVPVVIVFASLFPRAGKKFIVKLVGLLGKIRIVKHKYPTMKKYVYEMEEYRTSLKALFTHFGKLVPLVLICIVETATYVLIPFCVVMAIANIGFQVDVFVQVICLSMIAFYSSSLIPTPGNSGANEAASLLAFATIVNIPGVHSVIGWIVLIWRFFTYYMYILTGIGINIFEVIRSAVRARRAARAQTN